MAHDNRPNRDAWRERRLPGRLFAAVRLCARDCLLEAKGDQQAAIALATERMELVVGSVWVSIAIQLAIKLIVWWITNGISEPSVVAQYGEPGTGEDDLDEWDDQ